MRMLSQQGYEVHYASMGEEEILDCDKSFTVPFTRSPFRVSNITAYKQLKAIIDREGYDIIHTHTPMGSVVTRLAARAARKKGTRVIYTAHGFHFFKGAPILNWLIYYPVERYMARHTDTLITINKEDYERAKAQFNTDVQYVAGVGVDLNRFKPVPQRVKLELRKQYGFDKNDRILIYPAELNANKNQSFLIRQMPKLLLQMPNAKLLLCGKGDSEKEYGQLINMLQLNDSVKLMGYRDDLEKLFQLSDLSVASSIREGLGLNIIEAMATGLPVVASKNRGHSDAVGKEYQRYQYTPDDAKAYVANVCLILQNSKTDAIELRKASLNQSSHFAIDKIVRSMQSIYQAGTT